MLASSAVPPGYLFLLNFLIDLCLLWFATAISWGRPRPIRLLLVATVGAFLATLPVLAPGTRWLLSGPAMFGVSLVLVLMVSWPFRLNQFIAVLGGFWAVVAVAGGMVFVLKERAGALGVPSVALVGTGVAGGLVGMLYVWQAYRGRREVRDRLYQLKVYLRGQAVVLTALMDTGNSLRTLGNRLPVIVVEAEAMRSYLPPEVMEALTMGWDGLEAIPEPWRHRCQIIPCQVVGNTESSVLAIEPDGVEIWEGEAGRWVEVGAVIGLATHSLGPQGQYQALLAPQVLEEARVK